MRAQLAQGGAAPIPELGDLLVYELGRRSFTCGVWAVHAFFLGRQCLLARKDLLCVAAWHHDEFGRLRFLVKSYQDNCFQVRDASRDAIRALAMPR